MAQVEWEHALLASLTLAGTRMSVSLKVINPQFSIAPAWKSGIATRSSLLSAYSTPSISSYAASTRFNVNERRKKHTMA